MAWRFNAATDRVVVPSGWTGSAATILLWFRREVDRGAGSNPWRAWANGTGGGATVAGLGSDGSGDNIVAFDSAFNGITGPPMDGTWRRLALRMNGTAWSLFYGGPTGTLTKVDATRNNATAPGSWALSDDPDFLNGDIANVKLFGRALSDAEVEAELATDAQVSGTNLLFRHTLRTSTLTPATGTTMTAGSTAIEVVAGPAALEPNQPPAVGAGADATINLGGTFNRVATENNNGSAITARSWTIISGPSNVGDVIDSDATLAWTPGDDGVWVLRYSATNANGTGTDDVQVTVNPVAPTVGAGADATNVPTNQVFTRTATENNNGNAVSARAWTIVSGPAGAGSTIGTALMLEWTPLVAGTYVLRYSATNNGGTGTDDVQVQVILAPPEVSAGADVSFVLGSVFNRNAAVVGNLTSAEWEVVSGPSHVGQTLSEAIGVSWVPPFLGTYVLRFTGTNASGTDTDTVSVQTTPPPTPPEQPDDGWTYITVPWGENSFTLRDQLPGQQYEFQLRAADIYNETSEWSDSVYAQSEPDSLPPSTPAASQVASSRLAVQISHTLGKSTGGTFNLEPDLNHLNVYIVTSPEAPIDTVGVDEGGTFAGSVRATIAELTSQTPVVATFPIPQTAGVWVKTTAVDNYGNESLPSQAVQATAELIDDAYISNLTVSKVTAGTITADWTQAAEMRTGTSGARLRMGYYGLELFNAANELVIDANTSDGSFYAVGTMSTDFAGRRMVVDGPSNELLFYPQDDDTRVARLFSFIPVNFPDDIAMEMRASTSVDADYYGRVGVSIDSTDLLFSPTGDGGGAVRKSGVKVQPDSVSSTVYQATGGAPWTADDMTLRAAMSVFDDGVVAADSWTSGGVMKARYNMNNDSITLQMRNGANVDGGSLYMEDGNGAVNFGKFLNGSWSSWIDFASDGDVNVYRRSVHRISAMDDGVELRPYAYTSILAGLDGGRLQIQAEAGSPIFFYWAAGSLNVGSGTTGIVNLTVSNTLNQANLINRMNAAEANINTLFTYAHSH